MPGSQLYPSVWSEPHSLCQHDELAGRPRGVSEPQALLGVGAEGRDVGGTTLGSWSARVPPAGPSWRSAGEAAAQDSGALCPNSLQANSAAQGSLAFLLQISVFESTKQAVTSR